MRDRSPIPLLAVVMNKHPIDDNRVFSILADEFKDEDDLLSLLEVVDVLVQL